MSVTIAQATVLASLSLALTSGSALAGLVTIEFEEFAPGTSINTQYIGQGVALLSSPSGDPTIIGDSGWPPPISGQGLIGFQPGGGIEEIRADFVDAVSFASIDGGDLSSDTDDMFLFAYDEFDQLLDSDNQFLNGEGVLTLSVSSGTPIAYVVFVSESSINGSSIVWDNLTFDPIPAPGVLALLGLVALPRVRRRS